MAKKIVQFDMDGVIIDSTNRGLLNLKPKLASVPLLTYDYNRSLDWENIEELKYFNNISPSHPVGTDVTIEEIYESWRKISILSPSYLLPEGLPAIKMLSETGKIKTVIRSMSFSEEIAEWKRTILHDFLKLDNVEYIPVIMKNKDRTKGNIAKEPIYCDYYIDDFMGNFKDYLDTKTQCLLFNQSYNQELFNKNLFDFSKVKRVYNLFEVAMYILKQEKLI